MIKIVPNIYEHKLLEFFWTYQPTDEEDGKLYALLSRICRAWVEKRNTSSEHETISDISLTEEERELIKKHNLTEHQNLEVRTRIQDVMLRFVKGSERLKRMRQAADGYMTLYRETGTVLYFVRGMEIRKSKQLYNEAFLKEFRDVVVSTMMHPGWLTMPLNKVKENVEDGLDNENIKQILNAYAGQTAKADTHWVDSYLDMLHAIGSADDKQWHYEKALNWERYADRIEENKKPNVFNANLHTILQDAYKEIFKVKEEYPEEYRRIRDKYNAAKKDFVESMSLFGVKTKYEIPKAMIEHVHKNVAAVELNSMYEAIIYYLQVPYFPAWKELIEKQLKQSIKQSEVIERFFPNSQTLDDEGNVVGTMDFERGKRIQVHRIVRAALLYHLVCLFERVCEHTLDYSERMFYKMLADCKPTFVEEDRVQVWAKAYNCYFNGDMVTTSHLLMPQVEHALHNLLEEIVEDVTKLDQEVQKEPTLSGILTQLKPYCNPTLYDELYMFLIDGNDVNYRNKLLHGLMWSMDMLRYGHYLFYVANLLFFSGRKFLEIGGDEKAVQ